jgi:hypothetical protein
VVRIAEAATLNAQLVTTPAEPACEKCNDTRVVPSRYLSRMIRCPFCTTAVRRDPDMFRRLAATEAVYRLNAAETRRIERAIAKLVALTLTADAQKIHARMDPDLFSTRRVMQRWGVSEGSGLPSENPDVYLVAQLPPLDPKTQEIVSDVVKASPPSIATFCWDVWASNIPISVIRGGPYYSKTGERRPGRYLSERDYYREQEAILRYLRFKFERTGHLDLVNLMRAMN